MERRASAATASRKLFAGKSAYDGVFAAPASIGTAVEDYREIFGGDGARGSSIPVLDVPELREGKVSVDVRSSEVDYADIFGGFGDLDYAVSLEELIGKLGRGCSSPEEARTPGYTSSPSQVLNPSYQASSNETLCQSVGEAKQVNMLYQKTNTATKNGTPGTTHIAQLHAIPGYTRLIDENISSRKIEDDSPVTSVESDTSPKLNFVHETVDGKWSQKSMSGLPPGGFVKQTSQGSVEVQRRYMQNESFSNGIIFDENDFGLGTYPPQVQLPSNLLSKAGNSERESKGSVASDFESSTSDAADAGASSPPYFGEEVDENSVAAASAAAVKLAIEKAQARMRLAKELMERKKEGLQSGEKLIFKDGLRAQKKRGEKFAAKANIFEEEKVREVSHPIKLSDWIKKKDGMKVGEVTPGSGDAKELYTTKEAVEGMQRKEVKIAQADHVPGEMKERETEPFCEVVRTLKHSATSSETDHVIENMSSANEFEPEEIVMANSRPDKPIDDGMKNGVVKEVHEWEDGAEKLYAREGQHELEAHTGKLMQAQQIHDPEGEIKLEVMQEHEETEKGVRVPPEQDVCDEKLKETSKSMGILQNVDAQDLKENKNMRLEEAHEGVENGKTIIETEEQEEPTNGFENIHETVSEVGILEDICTKEENVRTLDESCGREENEMEREEPCKWEENEKQQNDADGGGNMEKSGDRIHDQEIIGKATNTVDSGEESEEYFEDSRSEEIEQLEGEENDKELSEDNTREEETCEWTDTAEIWTEAFKYHGNNLEATDDTLRNDEHEHLSETKETCMQKESDKDDEATSEAIMSEDERILSATSSFEVRDSEKGSESSVELANDLDYNEIFDTNNVTTDGALELDEMMKEMKAANDTCPLNANGANFGNEENGYNLKATYEEERWACSSEAEAAQQPSTSGRGERVGETSKESETNQSSKKIKENDCETSITEERETKYTGQKEAGLDKEHVKKLEEAKEREKEHVKKLDEAKEREKEREKERMVVERAIREARERAFAEARERAAMEKLAAETRRKQVTEARERQGKASAEVNYQSSADKEAKLKAERAAVERATAEARERALAKAKSGKAASDARNQAEKFSSSDTQSRASCPSNNSNSELAQRAKAELERQQRTSERAAKALAEKNMRDLLAQKEQAERNRLAEALNADIKRWSSGKEKNLRALLSTLHYILGPDSGWQPVPLTDIVATAAVKKTYRRATLIVHPDKLQQRGASIQQKYLCEKVFDLLKEAWEKFNKEER